MTLARSASFALAALASLGAVSAATTPAFAANDVRSEIVKYDDLNLGSQSGVERLNTRVKMAAKRVCNATQMRDLQSVQAAKACLETALTRAGRDIEVAVARQGGERLASAELTVAR